MTTPHPPSDQEYHKDLPAEETYEEAYDDDDYSLTAYDKFCIFLDRFQWVTLIVFFTGLLFFFIHRTVALYLIGASLLYSGLVPMLSGYYRGPFGVLTGLKARLRGSLSLALGLAVVGAGLLVQFQ